MSVYDKIFPPRVLTLPNGKQVSKPRSRAPLAAVILVAMTALSVEVTGFDMEVLVSRIKEFFVILGDMIPPEWDYMPQIWQPLFDTIKMSLLGSFIGSILVVPFAMLASTNIIHSRVIVAAMRLLLSIIRTLPTLVSALIATYIFGLGTLAGTTAIAIFTFAYIGKILYEEIETVDMGPFEAMEAMGATKVRSFISAWTWAPSRPWRPWGPPRCGRSSAPSCPRCCPPISPTACSALRATCATPPFWVMWALAVWA